MILIGFAGGHALWFATKVLIVRSVSKEEFGLYSLAVAIVSILSLIGTAGLNEGTSRYISILVGEGKTDDAASLASSGIRAGVFTSLTCSLILYLVSVPLARHVFYLPDLAPVLKVISAFIFFHVVGDILVGINRGYGNIRPNVYYIQIGQPLYFLLMLAFISIFGLPYESVMYAYVAAMALAWLGLFAYSRSRLNLQPFRQRSGRQRELLKFSLPLLGVAVVGVVLNWTDTLMIGRYLTASDVGTYNVSVSLVRLLVFGVAAANFVFMPLAGELYSKNRMKELKRIYQVLTKWVFSITLPIFFVLFFFPEMTISFLFGEVHTPSSAPLRLLCLGFMANVVVGTNVVIMMILGLSRHLMKISVMGTCINILLNYVLIKHLDTGIMGAALATTVSYIIISAMNSFALYKASRIHPVTFSYLGPMLGSVIAGLAVYALAKTLPLHFWMMPVYLILFLGGYVITLLLTKSIEREDIFLFESVANRAGLELHWIKTILNRFAADK